MTLQVGISFGGVLGSIVSHHLSMRSSMTFMTFARHTVVRLNCLSILLTKYAHDTEPL